MEINLKQYFNRVQFTGFPTVDLETLTSIHRQQCFNIPFDMLDYHLGILPNLTPEYIFNKLVLNKRGGGCSQVNELLAIVLEQIGFKVSRLLSRILYNVEDKYTVPLSHKILLVELPNKQTYLCDTGFAMYGIIEPIPLKLNTVFEKYYDSHRLISDERLGTILQRKFKDEWVDLFSFTSAKYIPQDYIPINYYNSNNPNSKFVKNIIVILATKQGRKTIVNNEYKEYIEQKKFTIEITSNSQYHELLAKNFNIEVPDKTVDLYSIAKNLS